MRNYWPWSRLYTPVLMSAWRLLVLPVARNIDGFVKIPHNAIAHDENIAMHKSLSIYRACQCHRAKIKRSRHYHLIIIASLRPYFLLIIIFITLADSLMLYFADEHSVSPLYCCQWLSRPSESERVSHIERPAPRHESWRPMRRCDEAVFHG